MTHDDFQVGNAFWRGHEPVRLISRRGFQCTFERTDGSRLTEDIDAIITWRTMARILDNTGAFVQQPVVPGPVLPEPVLPGPAACDEGGRPLRRIEV